MSLKLRSNSVQFPRYRCLKFDKDFRKRETNFIKMLALKGIPLSEMVDELTTNLLYSNRPEHTQIDLFSF